MSDKYNDLELISLDILRRGKLAARLVAFYDQFGARRQSWFRIFSDVEVAVIVGWRKENGEPNNDAVRQTRARLLADGVLEEVTQVQRGRTFWSYRPAAKHRGLMDDEALALLSSKTPGITYCRADDRALFELRNRIDDLPVIYLCGIRGHHPWFEVLTDLLDFTQTGTLDFWTHKAVNALKGKSHPLRSIEDHDLRLQVGLTGLDRGISRNLDRNSQWSPDDHVAWALDALTRVGTEQDWMPLVEDKAAAAWRSTQAASPKAKGGTVEARARLVLADLEKRAGLAAGAPDPRVARAVEEAKGRKKVSERRRRAAGAGPEERGLPGGGEEPILAITWDSPAVAPPETTARGARPQIRHSPSPQDRLLDGHHLDAQHPRP